MRMQTYLSALFVVLIATLLAAMPMQIHAQEAYTEDDAIALAASHPIFAQGLALREGWTAAAYDTGNRYGIWHVTFWDADGEELGWADVSPSAGVVYSWEGYFDLADSQYDEVQAPIRAALATDARIVALIGDIEDYDIYVDYQGWDESWGVWIEDGPDSLWVELVSTNGEPMSVESLAVSQIYFPYVLSYEDWNSGIASQAIAIAFASADVADALRDATWRAEASDNEDGTWQVYFWMENGAYVEATVDITTGSLIRVSVP